MFAYDREERRELKRGRFETSGAGVMVQNYEDPIKINKHVLIQSDELDTKTHHLSNTRVYYHPGYYTSGELKALNPLSPNGMVTNINFLPTIFIPCQEITLCEFMK